MLTQAATPPSTLDQAIVEHTAEAVIYADRDSLIQDSTLEHGRHPDVRFQRHRGHRTQPGPDDPQAMARDVTERVEREKAARAAATTAGP